MPPPFRAAMQAALPGGLTYPPELLALFDWVEAEDLVRPFQRDIGRGPVYATLFPEDAIARTENEEEGTEYVTGGTRIGFFPNTRAESQEWVTAWLGNANAEALSRLHIFCRTGGDGSAGALWRDDEGDMQIVHLGSGSGSVWMGQIGATPLDFLRLLAIGYEEICWPEEFPFAPDGPEDAYGPRSRYIAPNTAYRTWLVSTFATTIPQRGADIIREAPSMDAAQSDDPFWQWMRGRNA